MSHELFAATLTAFNTGITQLVKEPAFVEAQTTEDLTLIGERIQAELFSRTVAAMTPEEHSNVLRDKYGIDGQNKLGGQVFGLTEVLDAQRVDLSPKAQQARITEGELTRAESNEYQANMSVLKAAAPMVFIPALPLTYAPESDIWLICIEDETVRTEIAKRTAAHFDASNVAGPKSGNAVVFYVTDPKDPNTKIHLADITEGKRYVINCTLAYLDNWYIELTKV